MFAPSVAPLELFVRGTAIYAFLFFIFRFFMRRDTGSLSIADILLVVIVADASQNAMAGESRSVGDGVILVGTIVTWNAVLDWLSFHSAVAERLIEPRLRVLVRDGRIQHANLERELMTERELMAKLRERGVAGLDEVRRAYLESGGSVTVIRKRQRP